MRYHLVYGFAEGPWMGKSFHAAMQAAGHQQTDVIETADVIICHSAGCYATLPPRLTAHLVLIGPPYWPGKSLVSRMLRKIWLDLIKSTQEHRGWYWLKKTIWNTCYLVQHPYQNWRLTALAAQNDFAQRLKGHRITVVRNKDDTWSSPETTAILSKTTRFTWIAMTGEHDDCWHNPSPYVNLLESIQE